jgi:S1-C subfamily serine protease
MKRLLAAIMFVAWGARAEAADWYWIGLESDPDALVYVDRAMIHREDNGRMEVFIMEIFDKPLPTGATRQVIGYAMDCRPRRYERLGGGAFDEAGHRLLAAEGPPNGNVTRGSIAEGAFLLACGQPSATMVHIEDPLIHAGEYYHRSFPPLPSQPPQENGPPAAAPGADGQQGPERPSMSVGTAFFVGPEGDALTAYHVVDGADRLACRTIDGTTHEAQVVRMNQANDLALLRVNFRPTRYLGLAPRGSLRAGQRVFTVGYGAPSYLGINEPRFTEGVVSALSGLAANDAEVQITVPIQPGNSGGPLVNEAGQLVGIITSSAAEDAFQQEVGATPQSINWAVKADYAAPLLPSLPRHPPARPMTRAQAIALTHDAVCFVMALHGGDETGR